jgi:dTDP-4-amino-4,6-dideoxygalactose transaminase
MEYKMKIPFLDLPAQHQALEEELLQVFQDALKTASFVGGHQVQSFEEEFAQFCETKYCIGVNSGTDALRFALLASGIGQGDAVITVPNTFIATVEAISQSGATPVFVDVDERTYNMDPNKLEDYLKVRNSKSEDLNRLKAVIPVHLYGQPAHMDAILEIAQKYNLLVIEDACQAHGADYFSKKENRWIRVGSMGLSGTFSFYPGKNLGACGEGGAITTDEEEIAKKVRMLRDHGQVRKYSHEIEGYNGRLHALQAGCLRIKLKHLTNWNEKRRMHANRYNKLFKDLGGVDLPCDPPWSRAVHHLYVIRLKRRDELKNFLSRCGISTGLHYPLPIHLQKSYSHLGYKLGNFPISEKLSKEILSLPIYPELTIAEQEYIAECISHFISATND